MKCVVIESPYRGDAKRNLLYLRLALRDCFDRGEAPFASHGLYTQVFDDANEEQRKTAMFAGWEWMKVADFVAVYCNLGISPGMEGGISAAQENGIPVMYRTLPHKLLEEAGVLQEE